jgi:hypothetical protein
MERVCQTVLYSSLQEIPPISGESLIECLHVITSSDSVPLLFVKQSSGVIDDRGSEACEETGWAFGVFGDGDGDGDQWWQVLETRQTCQEAWRVLPLFRISSHHITHNQSSVHQQDGILLHYYG